LLLIVAANLVFKFVRRSPIWLNYALLFTSLAALFFVPTQNLLFESAFVRILAATFAFCLPAFFASLIFIESFSRVQFQATALGSNLFGALAGGLLESLSLWFGLRSLTLLAALLYLASALSMSRKGQPSETEADIELVSSQL
jgi:hypothetical protein